MFEDINFEHFGKSARLAFKPYLNMLLFDLFQIRSFGEKSNCSVLACN